LAGSKPSFFSKSPLISALVKCFDEFKSIVFAGCRRNSELTDFRPSGHSQHNDETNSQDRFRRPIRLPDASQRLKTFLDDNIINVLNVAGLRGSKEPKLPQFVIEMLNRVFNL